MTRKLTFTSILTLIILLVNLLPVKSGAEIILFKNGDKISGQLLSYNGHSFAFQTAGGTLEIPRHSINRIDLTEGGTESGTGDITDLLNHVSHSGLAFFADGQQFDANDFSAYLGVKWRLKFGTTYNIEEFINRVATRSDKTGNHYYVRLTNGERIKVSDWLQAESEASYKNIHIQPKSSSARLAEPSASTDANADAQSADGVNTEPLPPIYRQINRR